MAEPNERQELLGLITETSKNTKKIYLIFILFLFYCVIAILGTSDRQLILNEGTVLPILDVSISEDAFFITAPLLALFFFIYLQIHLRKLDVLFKKTKDLKLTADYVYPWILNFGRSQNGKTHVYLAERVIAALSEYVLLPGVLLLNGLWHLKKHEPVLSYVVGAAPFIGMFLVIYFGINRSERSFKEFFNPRSKKLYAYSSVLFVLLFTYFFIISVAIQGKIELFNVDLSYQTLITEPETDYPTLYWADLNGANLRGANLTSSVLKRADLRNADLSGANFRSAVLERADFKNAQLVDTINNLSVSFQSAHLIRAHLESAYLYNVNLRFARLDSASLKDTVLDSADLSYAYLKGTYLTDANLIGAVLRNVQLDRADLRGAQLMGAKLDSADLTRANLDDAHLTGADLRSTDLTGADLVNAELPAAFLRYADLRDANLGNANLTGADLTGANLTSADLNGADLRNNTSFPDKIIETNVTISQLLEVKTLYNTEFGDSFRAKHPSEFWDLRFKLSNPPEPPE